LRRRAVAGSIPASGDAESVTVSSIPADPNAQAAWALGSSNQKVPVSDFHHCIKIAWMQGIFSIESI
jgi:hypothetical protein